MKQKPIKTLLAFSLFTASACYSTQAASGDLYDGGLSDQKIYKFDPAGNQTTFVSGSTNFQPDWLAFDSKGNLFASNPANNAISMIPPDGSTISNFATGILANDLAFDAAGNLFAIDATTGSIFEYTPSGTQTTFAGPGINDLVALAFARDGNLFATRRGDGLPGHGSIVKFTPDGMMSTFYPAQAGGLFLPKDLAFDRAGNLYEADSGSGTIFKFAPNAAKTTFKAGLNAPQSLAFDRAGNLFAGECPSCDIVKITPAGTQTVFASPNAIGGLAFEPPTAQLANISTRASVKTGAAVTIAGFIVTGTDLKQVVVRGLGPSLMQDRVPGVLADPTLDLHDSHGSIASNDDWQTAANANQIPVNLRPSDPRESAILIKLPPGNYTAIMAGKNKTTGIGLVEVYDITTNVLSELANVSTRAFVGTQDAVTIGGFIAGGGNGSIEILVRGLGPSLTQFNVPGVLADPKLELHNANGALIASNDDWQTAANSNQIPVNLRPSDPRESAILIPLQAGNYTAIMSGKNATTGIGLVEVFKVP